MPTPTPPPGAGSQTDERAVRVMKIDLPDGSWLSRVGPLSLWALYNKEYVRMLNRFESEFVDAAIAAGATAEQSECKWPNCMSEKAQQDLADEVAVSLYGTAAPAVEVARPDLVAMREVLQQFVDYHSKPAGLTLMTARNREEFGEWLENIEAREKEMVAKAIALLAPDQTTTGEKK